jgi:hypothetical protein
MPELAEYELDDGTTVQLTAEDAKRIPGAKKVGDSKPKNEPAAGQRPVQNRARR